MEIVNSKTIICPICNTSILENEYIEIYIPKLLNKDEYKLYHCTTCEIEFWSPLSIIPDFYENNGNEAYEIFHSGLRDVPYWQKPFFKYVPLKAGRVLDIGCGDGVFLNEAQKKGFEVWGLDFDAKSIKIAQEKFGLKNIFAMSLEKFAEFAVKQNIKFDIISFFEVLEHQDQPDNFINIVKTLLNSEGYIVGSVPNRDSIIMKMERKLSYGDFPPHHFLRFSENVIKNFFKKKGFNDVEIFFINYPLMEYSAFIENILTRKVGKKIKIAFKKNIIEKNKNKSSIKTFSNKKKITFNILKMARNISFLPLAVISRPLIYFTKGNDIYFQAKLIKK